MRKETFTRENFITANEAYRRSNIALKNKDNRELENIAEQINAAVADGRHYCPIHGLQITEDIKDFLIEKGFEVDYKGEMLVISWDDAISDKSTEAEADAPVTQKINDETSIVPALLALLNKFVKGSPTGLGERVLVEGTPAVLSGECPDCEYMVAVGENFCSACGKRLCWGDE